MRFLPAVMRNTISAASDLPVEKLYTPFAFALYAFVVTIICRYINKFKREWGRIAFVITFNSEQLLPQFLKSFLFFEGVKAFLCKQILKLMQLL